MSVLLESRLEADRHSLTPILFSELMRSVAFASGFLWLSWGFARR